MDSHLVDRFERDMTDLLRRLRAGPAQILWRSYSPSHFGGELGSFILDKADQGREQQDEVKPTRTWPDMASRTAVGKQSGQVSEQAATITQKDRVKPMCVDESGGACTDASSSADL